ncbi:MAG: hypothetical protein ACYCOU_17535, partial [Sulfobacillus sp.]
TATGIAEQVVGEAQSLLEANFPGSFPVTNPFTGTPCQVTVNQAVTDECAVNYSAAGPNPVPPATIAPFNAAPWTVGTCLSSAQLATAPVPQIPNCEQVSNVSGGNTEQVQFYITTAGFFECPMTAGDVTQSQTTKPLYVVEASVQWPAMGDFKPVTETVSVAPPVGYDVNGLVCT